MKRGLPPTARNARTGEFTPPGITCKARLKSCSDFDMGSEPQISRINVRNLWLKHVSQFQCVVRDQNICTRSPNCSCRFENNPLSLNPSRASCSLDHCVFAADLICRERHIEGFTGARDDV